MTNNCPNCKNDSFINHNNKIRIQIIIGYVLYVLLMFINLYRTYLQNQNIIFNKFINKSFSEYLSYKLSSEGSEGLFMDILLKYLPPLGIVFIVMLFVIPDKILGQNYWICNECGEEVEFD